jgi:phosphoglycerate dehydrogenase-like enzyme
VTVDEVSVAAVSVDAVKVWIPDADGIEHLGSLPPGVEIEVFDGGEAMPSDPGTVRFWVPPFLSNRKVGASLAPMVGLDVVQLMSAGAEAWADQIPDGVTLCDARGVHDSSTSEWVVTAILASLRGFVGFARDQAARRWNQHGTDELAGKRVLIVGAGSIGNAVRRRLEPFGADVVGVARRGRDGVHAVAELPTLLPDADVVVLLMPLTDATRGMVDAEFLASMKVGALLVNAARGPIVDTDALVKELASERLFAAIDVTDPEPLPNDHPLWTVPNLLLTPHVGGAVPGLRARAYRLVGEQLRRYAEGAPLENVVTDGY